MLVHPPDIELISPKGFVERAKSEPARVRSQAQVRTMRGVCIGGYRAVPKSASRAQTTARSTRERMSAVQCPLRLTRMSSKAKSRFDLGFSPCLSGGRRIRQ